MCRVLGSLRPKQVLDARDPLSSRTLDVERYVRAAGADKKLILLLNKIGALLLPPLLSFQACRIPLGPIIIPSDAAGWQFIPCMQY